MEVRAEALAGGRCSELEVDVVAQSGRAVVPVVRSGRVAAVAARVEGCRGPQSEVRQVVLGGRVVERCVGKQLPFLPLVAVVGVEVVVVVLARVLQVGVQVAVLTAAALDGLVAQGEVVADELCRVLVLELERVAAVVWRRAAGPLEPQVAGVALAEVGLEVGAFCRVVVVAEVLAAVVVELPVLAQEQPVVELAGLVLVEAGGPVAVCLLRRLHRHQVG